MSSAKKRGLGRGLDSLLGSASTAANPESGDELRDIPLEHLKPGAHQPRRSFEPGALEDLAQSIAAQGVVQPILVRPAGNDRYEIVAGERRWRAAKLAGLATIPAVIRTLDERAAMAVGLVENIQRADLNPLEEALALDKLIRECGLTHEQTAEAVGRKRSGISNLLRLLDLEPAVQTLVRDGALSLGHAKVLLGVNGERQVQLAERAAAQQLSVRQLETLLKLADLPPPAPKVSTPESAAVESRIRERLGLGAKLRSNARGRGNLTISFKNAQELDKLLTLLS